MIFLMLNLCCGRDFGRSSNSGGFASGRNSNFTLQGRGNFYRRGRGRGFRPTNNFGSLRITHTCQLCGKTGHIVSSCWYWFDSSCSMDLQQYNSTLSQPSISTPRHSTPQTPHAHLATPEFVSDASWYVESAASNHLTFDDASFYDRSSNAGTDQVYIGDGSGLSVHSYGSTFFFCVILF